MVLQTLSRSDSHRPTTLLTRMHVTLQACAEAVDSYIHPQIHCTLPDLEIMVLKQAEMYEHAHSCTML